MNAGRKNTKAIHEIPAKGIHFHWSRKKAMAGNVRPKQDPSKTWNNQNKKLKELQVNLYPVISVLENWE
jgi:hypothetical protein